MTDPPICQPRSLPSHLVIPAARVAAALNPANAPALHPEAPPLTAYHLAVLTSKYFGPRGVALTVGFLDPIDAATREKILFHANLWNQYANVRFAWTADAEHADIRVVAGAGVGYASLIGTDIKAVRSGPTMWLEGYLIGLPDSEYMRVVPHEFAHAVGAIHTQVRRWVLDRLDFAATRAFYRRTQGWSDEMINFNVLTAIDDSLLLGSTDPADDEQSIMEYPFPSECTKDHRPIVGGTRITKADARIMNSLYPLANATPMTSADIAGRLAGIL